MSARTTRRLGRLAFGLTVIAVLWSAALVVGAFVAPVYSGATSSATTTIQTTDTLVGANGLYAAFVAAIPLAFAVVVWWALHRTCTQRGTRARAVAWALTSLLLVFCLLTGFTIGAFALPAALALCGACIAAPDPAPATA